MQQWLSATNTAPGQRRHTESQITSPTAAPQHTVASHFGGTKKQESLFWPGVVAPRGEGRYGSGQAGSGKSDSHRSLGSGPDCSMSTQDRPGFCLRCDRVRARLAVTCIIGHPLNLHAPTDVSGNLHVTNGIYKAQTRC